MAKKTTKKKAGKKVGATRKKPAAAKGAGGGLALPSVSAAEKRRAMEILKALRERYPGAKCALEHESPHELLIATILSAQCTDAAVNRATPALFRRFPAPKDFAESSPEEIEPYVKSLGFFRNKAKALHSSMHDVVHRFGGKVPRTMEELLTLQGVARKTANVVLGNAFGVNVGVVVDTHVQRLSGRLGLAPEGATVAAIEKRLMALFPRESWTELSHLLISHGRAVCKARGGTCATDAICKRFCSNSKGAAAASKPGSGRRGGAKTKGRKAAVSG